MSRYMIRYKKPSDTRVDTEIEARATTWPALEQAILNNLPPSYGQGPYRVLANSYHRTFTIRAEGTGEVIAHGSYSQAHLTR